MGAENGCHACWAGMRSPRRGDGVANRCGLRTVPRAHLLCYLNRHRVRLHADESVSRVEGGTVYVMRESGEEFAYEGFGRIVTAFGSRSTIL